MKKVIEKTPEGETFTFNGEEFTKETCPVAYKGACTITLEGINHLCKIKEAWQECPARIKEKLYQDYKNKKNSIDEFIEDLKGLLECVEHAAETLELIEKWERRK